MAAGDAEEARSGTIPPTECESFGKFVEAARAIKKEFVDPRRTWYAKHQFYPFLLFRIGGVVTIILGVTLPAVALADIAHKDVILSVMSVAVAALTGLSSFFRWEISWRGRELSKFAIDALDEKWELELANASHVLDASERLKHAYLATNDFFSNVRVVSAAETDEFFSGMQFPESDKANKP